MYIKEVKQRRKFLTAVYIEDEVILIDTQTFMKSGFKVGSEIDEMQLEELKRESSERRAFEKGLNLLSFRGHTELELKRKITQKAGSAAAEKAVYKLSELGLLNDQIYAKEYARELVERRYYSKMRTAWKLSEKGIDREIIDSVLEDLNIDPSVQIWKILDKRFTPMPTQEKDKKRMFTFLTGMGFSFYEIRSAISERGEILEDFED